jgi:hypothetical protein
MAATWRLIVWRVAMLMTFPIVGSPFICGRSVPSQQHHVVVLARGQGERRGGVEKICSIVVSFSQQMSYT